METIVGVGIGELSKKLEVTNSKLITMCEQLRITPDLVIVDKQRRLTVTPQQADRIIEYAIGIKHPISGWKKLGRQIREGEEPVAQSAKMCSGKMVRFGIYLERQTEPIVRKRRSSQEVIADRRDRIAARMERDEVTRKKKRSRRWGLN
jgi:hypothetical protein